MIRTAFGITALLLPMVACAPVFAARNLPMDHPVDVNGVRKVCTGVGDTAENDPRWKAYPLKIVLAGKGGQYLADGDVSVSRNGREVVSVHCDGPWVLFQLPPARYGLSADLEHRTATTHAYVSANGQGRAILRFPDQGGAISREHLLSRN